MRWIVVLVCNLFIFSCTKDETNASQTSPTEKLAYVIPEGYPSDVLDEKALENRFSFKIKRLQAVAATSATPTPELSFSLEELAKQQALKAAKYPNLDALNAVEFAKLKKYFPKITPQNYLANEQTIRDYFEKLIASDLVNTLTIKTTGIMARGGISDELNSKEEWFLVSHNRMVKGIRSARELVQPTGYNEYTNDYNPNVNGPLQDKKIPYVSGDIEYARQTRNDALRHAMLTALIAKLGGRQYGSVNKACDLAIEFTDLHEYDPGNKIDVELSHLMDRNNNRVGAEYFRKVGWRENVGFLNWNVQGPPDNTMLDALFNKGFKKGLYYRYLDWYFNSNRMVYLRETNEAVLIDANQWPKDVPRPTPAPPTGDGENPKPTDPPKQ